MINDDISLMEFLKDNLRIEIIHKPYGENYVSVELQVRDVTDTKRITWQTISEDSFPLD